MQFKFDESISSSCWLSGASYLQGTRCTTIINGDLAGDELLYGAALSVQNTNSGYGNTVSGNLTEATGGSEIGSSLWSRRRRPALCFARGNLESNYNKLSVFIDSEPGGMNKIDGNNAPEAVDPFCCPGTPAGTGALQRLNGFQFDAGFEADHFIGFSNAPKRLTANAIHHLFFSSYYGDLTAGSSGLKSDIGFQRFGRGLEPGLDQESQSIWLTTNAQALAMLVAHQQPTCLPSSEAYLTPLIFRWLLIIAIPKELISARVQLRVTHTDVTTGIEFSIPLSVIGDPTEDIRITTFIGNSQYSHVSNQFVA